MSFSVSVQAEDFDVGRELDALRIGHPDVGAIASFIGTVRDVNDSARIGTLTLEHYPGMTEASLAAICAKACERWALGALRVVHRHGTLSPTDRIVLVAASSAHRADAFAACAFVMDFLKTEAPFWKREATPDGPRWVEARSSDEEARARWSEPAA